MNELLEIGVQFEVIGAEKQKFFINKLDMVLLAIFLARCRKNSRAHISPELTLLWTGEGWIPLPPYHNFCNDAN